MDLIRWSMNKPVTITVGVLLVVFFGLIGLTRIPIQLTPTVDRPLVTVQTFWPGRSPQEVVDEITRKQEEQLKNVSNLKSMRSTSREGQSVVTLEFYIGSDVGRALQEVSDALRQVRDYPEEVKQPTVKAADGASENAIAWIIIDLDPEARAAHPDFDVTTLFSPLDREVKPYLERVDGVAQVNIYGGRERQIQVLLDPAAMSQRGLTHTQVIQALQSENRNISAGTIAEGKRDIRVRVLGQFTSTQEILDTVVAYRDAKPVYVRDIGTAEIGYEKQRGFVRALGSPCLALNVIRQSGANVMTVMSELRTRLDEVRADILPRIDPALGKDLRLRQVYDETDYIHSAVDLVLENLWMGGAISVLVLILFLRSLRATGVIALAIPICVIGTFLVILGMGRTLNVISLAGLAFSTGMVVDNAIVVLDNIVRRRSMGDPPAQAVYRGAREVWGAILASTLTHVCVFVPVLTIREEAGQLFFDLSLAMAVAVSLSLVVAIMVVPCACALLFARGSGGSGAARAGARGRLRTAWDDLFGLAHWGAGAVARFAAGIYWLMSGWRAVTLRPLVIVVMTLASLIGAKMLMPPLDYLPAGNRNLVFGGLLIPPGLSNEQQNQIAKRIERTIEPYVRADIKRPETVKVLAPIPRREAPLSPFDPVPVEDFFIGAFDGGMFVGGTSQKPQTVIPIATLFTNSMSSIPDSFGGARQASIFGQGAGGGNTVDLEISGPNIERVVAAASTMLRICGGAFGFSNVQPDPANFNLTQPEVRVRLKDFGRQLGLRTQDVGVAVRGLFDGAYAGEYLLDGRRIDILVLPTGGRLESREQLADVSVATPAGRVVPISTLVEVQEGRAPQEVKRIEELPSVALRLTPPSGLTVEGLMDAVREKVIAPAVSSGLIDSTMRVRLEGTAAKLDEVRSSLLGRVAPPRPLAPWQKVMEGVSIALALGGAGVGALCLVRAGRRRSASIVYGAIGALLLGLTLGGTLLGVTLEPQLLIARFVWALLVTYLLMCALFESFIHPLVIMFSVPLAMVGGFAALRLVHDWTASDPTIAPQQLDVLTMLGFVMLIGTVVNNAILLVEQALNFMTPGKAGAEFAGDEALPPLRAIQESVRTRIRPIFMTAMTTIGGGLPLVIAPGAGSEMYRGLGAVVCGGLLVSTVFTLVLVPLVFSLALDMQRGLRRAFGFDSDASGDRPAPHPHAGRIGSDASSKGSEAASSVMQPA